VSATTTTTAADLLAQAAQVAADAIVGEDVDGVVMAWNDAASRLYGLAARDAVGSSAEPLLRPDGESSAPAAARARALTGTRVDAFDSWHARADGSRVPVSTSVAPLRRPDGSVCGTATSAIDISGRLRLDADLQDARRALEQQNAVLVRSNRDLEQFAYVASHDLSEPLRVITGFITQIERRYGGSFDERGERYLRHIVEGAARMRALIDDLLEYSRFLRADHTRTEVPLREVVDAALGRLSAAVQDTGAEVEVGELPVVLGDRAQLQSMVQNLLSNALKFTAPGEVPRLRVSGDVAGASGVLHVDDAGIGIEPEFRDRVFRMFQRLHVREDYSGTGIGLAVVQQVVELHDGSITVEDSPLGGARFRVALPLATTGGGPRGDDR
jgi:PAS domain S-box-containing protein